MSVIVAVVVIVALLAVVAVVARPRLRGRSLARGSRPVARRQPVAVAAAETEVDRDARRRPRRERTLIAEGEAIREHVEARLANERPVGAHPVGRDPLREGDEIAWQREQEERQRPPATYGAPVYGPAATGEVPVSGDSAYGDPAHGAPVSGGAAYGDPAYGDAAVVPARGRPVLSARDQLAWQLEQDQRARYPEDYPPSRPGMVPPVGAGLQPGLPPVSDALELQLQEIAVRSRGRVSPAVRPAAGGRRPGRFARSRRVAEDPEDPRLAG